MGRRFILIALAGTITALALTVGSAAGSPGADSQVATRASLLSTAVDPLQEELAIDAMALSTSGGTVNTFFFHYAGNDGTNRRSSCTRGRTRHAIAEATTAT